MVEITQGRRNRSLYFVAGVVAVVVGILTFLFFNGPLGSPQERGSTIGVPKAQLPS
ncbi:hypothetical protein [Reyranella sp. CPCC 100927]|uniref:hypothetical protein n=1 Tax=Reyranella sp. CPCC 100927 TaxID=2599616 RepID=UPI0015B64DBF|nr:hypothetical protein [Reyranella sp. CPCC 100927]